MASEAKKLGFGSSITIDGTETGGTPMRSVPAVFPDVTGDDRLALASIGQGDTLETPLLNAMIAATVANKGVMLHPTLVDRVRSSDLSIISERSTTTMSEGFSTKTADTLTTMMQGVVTKESTNLTIPGISVAAKTGTAQVGVNNSSINAWVSGFAPADNPKIAISVLVANAGDFGALSAGPIMKQMMEAYLK